MYKSFMNEVESIDSSEAVQVPAKVLAMTAPRDMWITDFAIDTHIRNIVATYGIDAAYEAIRRLTNGEQVK